MTEKVIVVYQGKGLTSPKLYRNVEVLSQTFIAHSFIPSCG